MELPLPHRPVFTTHPLQESAGRLLRSARTDPTILSQVVSPWTCGTACESLHYTTRSIKNGLFPSSFSVPFDVIKNKHSVIGTSTPFAKIILLKWLPSSDLGSVFPCKSNVLLLVFLCLPPAAQSNGRSLQRKIAHRKKKKLGDVILVITTMGILHMESRVLCIYHKSRNNKANSFRTNSQSDLPPPNQKITCQFSSSARIACVCNSYSSHAQCPESPLAI